MNVINENILYVLLFMWGDEYIEMFERYSMPCLRMQKYKSAQTKLLIYTKPEKLSRIQEIVAGTAEVELLPECEHPGLVATRFAIARARQDNCRLLWMTPDMIFGSDSIANMQAYAHGNPVTVAAIDLRVDYDAFKVQFPCLNFDTSSAQLVRLAFGFPHQCTTKSIDGTASLYSGVSLRPLATAGLWSIVHRIPTPYLCYFTEDDEKFWNAFPEGIGGWDHVWPEKLVQQGRFRFVGNSDMAFVLHLTGRDHAHAPVGPPSFEEFYRPQEHHRVLGNFVGTVRENV